MYSFREAVVREANRDCIFELLRLDYWLARTGIHRRCGELFTSGLDGYRRNYHIAERNSSGEFRELLRDRFSGVANVLVNDMAPAETFPYTMEMIRIQELLLSDAMHADRPEDYEQLHEYFQTRLRFIQFLWGRGGWASLESTKLYERLAQGYRIVLLGLAGRAINLAESGRIADANPYLNVSRGAYTLPGLLSEDISQALTRDERLGFSLWSDWEMEGSHGEAITISSEQYPLAFFTVRLMELLTDRIPELDLRGSAEQVSGWFAAHSERLEKYVSEDPNMTRTQRRELAAEALQAAIRRDEVAEDYEILGRELSADRVSAFQADVYAAAFAGNSVEQLFERAGAFLYLSADAGGSPEERGFFELQPKAFLTDSPDGARNFYVPLEGGTWGQGLSRDVVHILCNFLDNAPHISAPLETAGELLIALDKAVADLDPFGEILVVIAGDMNEIETDLATEAPKDYVPAWRLSENDPIEAIGRYRGHLILRGSNYGERRAYVVDPRTWGCFIRAQIEGSQDLRTDVLSVSDERAYELLNGNPNHFASEPDEESKLRKLQTCVEIRIGARVGFHVIDATRARRISGLHQASSAQ